MEAQENILIRSKTKIESLQAFRALAFLCIFSSHCGITALGACGVSAFLVLSGFVMYYTYNDRTMKSGFVNSCRFSIGKIKRLYPLHILTMLSAVLIEYYMFRDFSFNRIKDSIIQVIINVMLLQTWIPTSAVYFSLNGVAWYLSACAFIYAVFPYVLKLLKKIKGCKQAVCIMFFIYCLQIMIGFCTKDINIYDNFSKWVTYILPIFRLGDFCIGSCLGYIYVKCRTIVSRKIATFCEIILFAITIVAQHIYKNQVGLLGSEWFRYTMLFTPISVAAVYFFDS